MASEHFQSLELNGCTGHQVNNINLFFKYSAQTQFNWNDLKMYNIVKHYSECEMEGRKDFLATSSVFFN